MINRIKIVFLSISLLTTFMYGSLVGKRIGIDPGHGGADTGAVAKNGLTERETALAIGLVAKKYLLRDGVKVTMTRVDQGLQSLQKKVNKLNAASVHKAVAIHLNAASPSVNRTMDFVYCGQCSRSAGDLAVNLVDQLAISTHLSKLASINSKLLCNQSTYGVTKCPSKVGVGQGNLYVLRKTTMPAVLVEVSFLSHIQEAERLKKRDYIDKQGYAIYAGIAEEYGEIPLPRDGTSNTVCQIKDILLNRSMQDVYDSSCSSKYRLGSYAKNFKFTLTKQQKVAIKLDADDSSDAYLYLKHENGNMIVWDDDSAGSHDAEIVRILPAGTYLLEATTYKAKKVGNFTISMTPKAIADPCSAKNISLNQTMSGVYAKICKSQSRYDRYAKYFTFTLTKQKKVTITLDADYTADAYLYLKHTNGNMIVDDDDSAGKRDSQIVRILPAGTYVLEATTYHKKKIGNFKISIQ